MALWIIGLLDFELGSLKSLGPTVTKYLYIKKIYKNFNITLKEKHGCPIRTLLLKVLGL